MIKRFLKLFAIYSYVSAICYIASENFLTYAKNCSCKRKGSGTKLEFESLWRTTIKRFKQGVELIYNG